MRPASLPKQTFRIAAADTLDCQHTSKKASRGVRFKPHQLRTTFAVGLFTTLFGSGYRHRARRDQWMPGTVLKNLISPVNAYGTCFSCRGSGARTLDCRACDGTGKFSGDCRTCAGTGSFSHPAKPCFTCDGTGSVQGVSCRRCAGTGVFKPAQTTPCRKCGGTGHFSATCNRCDGSGEFEVSCHKCAGSGWHRF